MVKILNVGLGLQRKGPGNFEERKKLLRQYARTDTTIDIIEPLHGLPIDNLEWYSYEAFIGGHLLAAYKKGEDKGYDAILQTCFYDPLVREAREILQIPVIGIAEASMHIASILGAKFSVIVGRTKWIDKMAENARRCGFESKIASWIALGEGVQELSAGNEKTIIELSEMARKCIDEDGAEVIVMGCGGFVQYAKPVSERVGVPFIDSYMAGVKMAELLADLYLLGIKPSKANTYEKPPADVLERIYSTDIYKKYSSSKLVR